MDPIAAVLCGLGAAVIAIGAFSGVDSALPQILFAAGLYGVYRATRATLAPVSIGVLLLALGIDHVWSFVPNAALSHSTSLEPTLREAPHVVSGVLVTVALILSVPPAASRIGWGLVGLTLGALALGLLAKFVALLPTKGSMPEYFFLSVARGWQVVGRQLTGIVWIAVGVSPLTTPALSRRVGALFGALGAALLAAALVGGRYEPERVLAVLFVLTIVAAWILSVVGMIGLVRAGAGPAAWAGIVLAGLQIVLLPIPFAVFSNGPIAGRIFGVAATFGFLGVALAALLGRGLPLRRIRWVIGSLFAIACLGSAMGWFSGLLAVARIVRVEDPLWPLGELVVPFVLPALVMWAAYLAHVAFPAAIRASVVAPASEGVSE